MHELFTCGVVVCLAAGGVDHPPAEAPRAEAEEVLVSVEVSDGEVVADDKHVNKYLCIMHTHLDLEICI